MQEKTNYIQRATFNYAG